MMKSQDSLPQQKDQNRSKEEKKLSKEILDRLNEIERWLKAYISGRDMSMVYLWKEFQILERELSELQLKRNMSREGV
jgi:hypothetical protein